MSEVPHETGKLPPSSEPCSKAKSPVKVALRTSLAVNRMTTAREELLHNVVFSRITGADATKKPLLGFRRLLATEDSCHKILPLIWKESLSDEELASVRLTRSFPNGMTQHGLAVALATSPQEVSALNSYVRNVSIAAERYELVTRTVLTQTRVFLQGTGLLHRFMLDLSAAYAEIGLVPPLTVVTVGEQG